MPLIARTRPPRMYFRASPSRRPRPRQTTCSDLSSYNPSHPVSLSPGTRLGAYEVTGLIGAGGMGEAYRARDMKLGRDVALKILPAAFTHDAERIARFQREAQVLASLNHPNIAAIYGFEEAAG